MAGPTREVFKTLGASLLPESSELTDRESARNLRGSGPESFPDRNDLEGAAERLRGELAVLRNALTVAGASQARLSGSGSTLFAVFPDEVLARAAGSEIGSRFAVRTAVVGSVSRNEFEKRAFPPTGMKETAREREGVPMGSRQVVSQQSLELPIGGSNPPSPAISGFRRQRRS